ncbi:MAG: nucleotidyltransferase domain-containing protein [bacterium]|nr:nucleotidyltransferase domain-containing protein [bacterium]
MRRKLNDFIDPKTGGEETLRGKTLVYLNKKEKRVMMSFVKELREKLSGKVVSIRLFGSKVRGDFTKDSDIDIFVLVKKRKGIKDKVRDIAADYFFDTNIPLAPVVYNLSEYKRNKELGSFFFESVEREGIVL